MPIVEGVYRLLGVIAQVNERLGRFRVNFVPTNIILIVGLGALAFASWSSVAKVLASRKTPEPQTVDTLISATRFSQGYVAVQGRLMADSRLSLGDKGATGNLELDDYTWVPLVDRSSGRAVFVQFAAAHAFPANGADVTVEGILRPVNSLVTRRLKDSKYVHAGFPIDRRFMVIAGRQPGDLGGPLVYGSIFAVLALGLAWSMVNRNVVFMPTDTPLTGGPMGVFDTIAPEPLLVSGTLALDAKKRKFFIHVPAVVQRLESGDTALLSHLTTSSSYFGITTDENTGVWMLVMRPGSISEAQAGYVFWGLKKMRATRFRYVNAMTGASERAVVATNEIQAARRQAA